MELTGRIIKKGKVSGEALVTNQPISFFGGTDPDRGILTEKGHELEGKSFAGKVLVFPQGKGSTVGSYALYRLKKNEVAPLAMINKECEPIVAVGAIISDIPCVDKIDIAQINTGDLIEMEGGKVTITKKVV